MWGVGFVEVGCWASGLLCLQAVGIQYKIFVPYYRMFSQKHLSPKNHQNYSRRAPDQALSKILRGFSMFPLRNLCENNFQAYWATTSLVYSSRSLPSLQSAIRTRRCNLSTRTALVLDKGEIGSRGTTYISACGVAACFLHSSRISFWHSNSLLWPKSLLSI